MSHLTCNKHYTFSTTKAVFSGIYVYRYDENHVKKYVCVHKGVRHVHFLNLDKSCKCTAYPVFPQNVLKVKRQWKRLKILG